MTSIARARAKIQNVHKLFLATPDVRKKRGTLEEEEKQKVSEERPSYPLYVVYADESGKTADYLIVGSMWILNAMETFSLVKEIADWRKRNKFESEFHFKKITEAKLPFYLEIIDILKDKGAALSFMSLSVERRGIGNINDGITQLYQNLLIKGIDHENKTGRAPLPRSMQLWKDSEQVGRDKLMLEEIKNRMREVSKTLFDGKLYIDEFQAVDSKALILIQLADLFTSSINRILNATGSRDSAKDVFAEKMLDTFGIRISDEKLSAIGDCAFHMSL